MDCFVVLGLEEEGECRSNGTAHHRWSRGFSLSNAAGRQCHGVESGTAKEGPCNSRVSMTECEVRKGKDDLAARLQCQRAQFVDEGGGASCQDGSWSVGELF